jgi:hypothetical protein
VNVFGSHVRLLYGLLMACSCSESLKIAVAVKGKPFRHLVTEGLGTIGSQRSRRCLGSMRDQRLPLVLVRRLWICCCLFRLLTASQYAMLIQTQVLKQGVDAFEQLDTCPTFSLLLDSNAIFHCPVASF